MRTFYWIIFLFVYIHSLVELIQSNLEFLFHWFAEGVLSSLSKHRNYLLLIFYMSFEYLLLNIYFLNFKNSDDA